MGSSAGCPDLRRLESLLQDSLSPPEQSALTEHVGDCTACQLKLDQLAAGPSADDFRQAERDRPPADSAFWAAAAELEGQLTVLDRLDVERPPDMSLDFLSPADDPSDLGRLDHFAIRGVIGRGGMGVVLRGFDTHLERDVAVKVLNPALAEDETARKRFCRESRTAASISHENVVAVHHVAREESTDLPYLVMQLIDGEPLDARLERVGRLPLKDVVHIGAQVAAGLAAAHEKGLIHRDVKPANVLMERGTDRVKLTDFGLARAAEDVRLTRSGQVVGTPLYMAPEQARGEELDGRADLFSLGVLLYELTTGQTPFEAKTPLAVLKRLTDERHRPVRELNPDTPDWLAAVIDRLLAKSPADRFQSAREVAQLLDLQWSALKTSSDVVPVCPKKRASRLRQVLVISAAVAAGALGMGVAVHYWSAREKLSPRIPEEPPPLAVLRAGSGTVWGVAFSPDDRTLAMAIEDGTIKLWDIETKTVTATLPGHQAGAWTVAFSPDGSRLVTSGDDSAARVWDLSTSKTLMTFQTSAAVRGALFDRDAKVVYTGDRQGNVRVWDVGTGREIRSWQHPGAVYALALSPDGKTIASAGNDRVVRVWDAQTGLERVPLNGHSGPVYGLAFRPDGKVLASASWDHTIRLWNPGTGELLRTLEGHSHDIWSVSFSPDGNTLVSAGQDGTVHVWDAATGKGLAGFRGHDGTVHCVAFSRDGSRIASGGRDGTVQLWKAAPR
jgi:WD40 repeat protein/serine/threonine protein kinase